MYCCWNRIPYRKGKWMICSWNLRLATTRSMRSMAFGTARSIPRSQQQVSCQGSTIWSCEKATLRRKIPGSLHWWSSTFEGSSPPTIKTIQRSRQQPLSLLIRLYQWLGPRKADLLGPRRSWLKNVANLLAPPPLTSGQRSLRPFSCSILPSFLPKKYLTRRLRDFFTNHISWIFRFFSSVLPLG